MKHKSIVYLFYILVLAILLCGHISVSVAQEIDQITTDTNKKKTSYQEDIKYVSFPNELKKYEVYPWEILKLPDFSKSYRAILGLRVKERWIRLLDGPSQTNKLIAAQSGKFVVIKSCKQHSCGTDNIVILFNPSNKMCWALLKEDEEDEQISWLGKPSNEIVILLEKVHSAMYPKLTR